MDTTTEAPTKLSITMRFNEWGRFERATRQRTLREADGTWAVSTNQRRPGVLCGRPTGRKRFREDDQEVVDYTAQVVVDMLNAGDIAPTTEHLQAVRAVIQRCGSGLKLGGAWWGHHGLESPKHHDLIQASAWLRCGKYLLQEMEAGAVPRGVDEWYPHPFVPNWWWPLDKITPSWLAKDFSLHEETEDDFWAGMQHALGNGDWALGTRQHHPQVYYQGQDNRLVHRIAELEVMGLTIFDLDYRSNGSTTYVVRALSKYLLADPQTSDALRKRAESYLQTVDQIRHWHCAPGNCKSKHRVSHTRCSGIYHEHKWVRDDYPCKEGYPCLHDDPDGFKLRFV